VVDYDVHPFLLEACVTHCQLLQADGRKEPNLKDLVTLTKVAMNVENRRSAEFLVHSRLRVGAAGTFKASKQCDQEARRIAGTTFCNLNAWFDSFEKHCVELGFAQREEANARSTRFIHPERIFNLDETNVSLDGSSGDRGGRPTNILLKWKMDSETMPGAVGKNKGTRVAKWIELRNAAVNDDDEPHPNWTAELEAELQRIKNTELTLKDTALEREKQKGVNDACAMIAAASPTTKHALLARLNGAGALNTESA
jgi:hypothetical protein